MFISFGIVIILIIVHLVLGIDMIWAWVLCWEADIVSATATVVIAATSVLAAFLGFVTYFKEIKKNRIEKADKDKRDRLSVQPFLGFKNGDGVDEQNPSIRNFKIVIFNKGVGPAFIKNFIMQFDGKIIKSEDYYKFFIEKLQKFENPIAYQLVNGSAIKAGEEIILIGFDYNSQDKKFDFISKLELFVEYESIYKDISMHASRPKSTRSEFDPKPNPLAEKMAVIHKDCFTVPQPWTERAFAQWLENERTFSLIQPRITDDPCGFALGMWLDSTQTELLTLGVYSYEQGKGYGYALLIDFIASVTAEGGKSIFLEVAENNAPALHLYKKVGFKRVGIRPAYYEVPNAPNIDAILMRFDITE